MNDNCNAMPSTRNESEEMTSRSPDAGVKEFFPPAKSPSKPRGLQIVRIFAPDEEKQLRALRLLSDASAPKDD